MVCRSQAPRQLWEPNKYCPLNKHSQDGRAFWQVLHSMPSPTGSHILSSLCRVRDWTKVVPQMQEQVDAEWFHSSLKHTHSKFCQEHTQHLRERCLQSAISSTCGKLAPPMIWVCDCRWDWMCQYKASQWKHHPSCSRHVRPSFKRQWIWSTGNWRLAWMSENCQCMALNQKGLAYSLVRG